jgi:hypothetical protein
LFVLGSRPRVGEEFSAFVRTELAAEVLPFHLFPSVGLFLLLSFRKTDFEKKSSVTANLK